MNQIIPLSIIAAGAVLSGVNPAAGALLIHFAFDGTTANTGTRSAADGTLVNSTLTGAPSPFPGSTNSLVLNGGNSGLRDSNPADWAVNGSFTVATWVNSSVAVNGNNPTIIGAYQNANPFHHNYLLRIGNGGLNFIARDQSGDMVSLSSSAFTANTWNHIAATFDATTGATLLYLNGSQVASGTLANFDGFATPTVAAIGGVDATNSNSIGGRVDDARIYDEVLSQSSIAALAVPEPAGAMLGGLGLLTLLLRRRK